MYKNYKMNINSGYTKYIKYPDYTKHTNMQNIHNEYTKISGPGGLVGGLDSGCRPKVYAQELASVGSRGLQGASRCLPWPPVV